MRTSDERTRTRRLALLFYVISGILIVIAFAAAIAYLGPYPSRVVVMSTGAPGGSFDVFGRRYKAVFERAGVELRLAPSAGSVENQSG